MKKKMVLEIIFIVIAVVALGYISFHYAKVLLAPSYQSSLIGSVCLGPFDAAQGREKCFQVELAKTEAQREKGLMDREELGKDKGMLFVFDKEGVYPFWMKNTLIPLDIIWINESGKVVFIADNVQPCKSLICSTVFPSKKAKYVLEINGGICQQVGLKVGDELKIN